MGPAQEHDEKARQARLRFWQERQAGNGNADNELGAATRAQPTAALPTLLSRQIAGVEPWDDSSSSSSSAGGAGGGVQQAFHGLTAEWTASVAARL